MKNIISRKIVELIALYMVKLSVKLLTLGDWLVQKALKMTKEPNNVYEN